MRSLQIVFSLMLISSVLHAGTVERLPGNPIITPDMVPWDPVTNINGPSLIRTPSWLKKPLGKYYLYFANHRGPAIHLAYADDLSGPWTMLRAEPLSIESVALVNNEIIDQRSHLGSPDIFVDDDNQQIRMYFHFRLPKLGHLSSVALSPDGLAFTPSPGSLGKTYVRHFRYQNQFYFIDKKGGLSRSPDGLRSFEKSPKKIAAALSNPDTGAYLRHVGLSVINDELSIFFTRIGDAPESIFRSSMNLAGNWLDYWPTAPELILQPTTQYEGADLPIVPSKKGDAKVRMCELRDPYIFHDDGETYLVYAVAGEFGIAIAKMHGQL